MAKPETVAKGTSRPASNIIAGYRYQILNSVLALIELRAGEELLLEIAEDFSVKTDGAQTNYQVKGSQALAGPAKFSLQSAAVRDVLNRFWESETSGHRLIFLARGGAAHEQGFRFPNNVSGLHYWQEVGLGADSVPMREALKQIFRETCLGEWLVSNPDDAEFRTRLLNRVTWQLDQLPASELEVDAKNRLRTLYSSMNLPVVNAPQALKALVDLVFETASRSNAAQRRLSRFDLDETIQAVAGTALVTDRMSAVSNEARSVELFLSEVSVSPELAQREATVSQLIAGMVGKPLMWIYGAHETGKSHLARLMAEKLGGRWIALDLWPVRADAAGALAAWRAASIKVTTERLDGIIVDDFIAEAAMVLRSRIGQFARELGARGARLIVTSHQPPSHALDLGAELISTPIAAPYFSQADIEELVGRDGGPTIETTAGWSTIIRVTTAGHPLLSAAKIASLRARGWPQSAFLEDVGRQSLTVQLTREEARRELLNDLSAQREPISSTAGALLRRIASVFDRADTELVNKLILAEPALPAGGDAFALLRGTWLESLSEGDVRVSPLVADIAADVPPQDIKRWRRLAAEHWISLRTLNERTLPLCFWNAYLGEHDWVLMNISQAMQSLGHKKLVAAAPILSPITAFATDGAIYTGSPIATVFIRTLQFAVADALDERDVAAKAAVRLLDELDILDEKTRALVTVTTAMQVLLAETKLPAALHIEYALRLRATYPIAEKLGLPPTGRSLLPSQLRADMDVSDFLFTRILSKISTTGDVLELIQALDALGETDRDRLIDAGNLIFVGPSVMINAGWSGDQTADRDMNAVLTGYNQIDEIIGGWKKEELKIEVICALSIILDEGLDRKEEALGTIEKAISIFGLKTRLVRQKAKILDHMEHYEQASDLILSIEDELNEFDPFDRALALRNGALSAARIEDFEAADRLAEKARLAFASGNGHQVLATAMLIERALIAWRAKRNADALALAAKALEEINGLDPTANRQAERTHQFARAIGGLFASELGEGFGATTPFDYGQASQLELSSAPLVNAQLGSIADNFRILAAVEAYFGKSTEIADRSLKYQSNTLHISVERLILRNRYCAAIRDGNIEQALLAGTQFLASNRLTEGGHKRARPEDFIVPPSDEMSKTVTKSIPHLLLDLIASEVQRGTLTQGFVSKLEAMTRNLFGTIQTFDVMFRAASQLYSIGPTAEYPAIYANAIAQSASAIEADPGRRLHRDAALLVIVSRSMAKDELADGTARLIINGWRDVCTNQVELLIGGWETAKTIYATTEGTPKFSTAAAVVLAAKEGVRHHLSDGWFGLIEAMNTATN